MKWCLDDVNDYVNVKDYDVILKLKDIVSDYF